MTETTLKGWQYWLGFAEDVLGYGHDESVEYANVRSVEEQNRESLRASERSDSRPPRLGGRLIGLPDEPISSN